MTPADSEPYSDRRLRLTVAALSILILILIVIGLLSHRTLQDNRPAWKLSPYGEMRDTGTVKVAKDSVSRYPPSESRH